MTEKSSVIFAASPEIPCCGTLVRLIGNALLRVARSSDLRSADSVFVYSTKQRKSAPRIRDRRTMSDVATDIESDEKVRSFLSRGLLPRGTLSTL